MMIFMLCYLPFHFYYLLIKYFKYIFEIIFILGVANIFSVCNLSDIFYSAKVEERDIYRHLYISIYVYITYTYIYRERGRY